MSIGPPPTPAPSYPQVVKTFITYADQPPPPPPAPDFTVIWSYITNEIHGEVLAIEETLGTNPWTAPGQTTLGGTLSYLYHSLAPTVHIHSHHDSMVKMQTNQGAPIGGIVFDAVFDDHPQYVRTDGARGFSHPVTSPRAWEAHQLERLDQFTAIGGMSIAAFQNLLNSLLGPTHPVTGGTPVTPQWGPQPPAQWKVTGGVNVGYSDYNGYLFINFQPAFVSTVIAFCFMRLPVPGRSHFGYTYQYMEDQLLLKQISPAGATVQFIEDIPIDRRAWCCMSWLAVGF